MNGQRQLSRIAGGFVAIGITVVVFLGLAGVLGRTGISLLAFWLITVAMAIVLFWAIGGTTEQAVPKLLIDERNKTSLSRLQMTLWTLVIFPALGVALLHNTTADISVSVSGAVDESKVIALDRGSTVEEALKSDGIKTTQEATFTQLNLSQILHDRDQIIVPAQDEAVSETVIHSEDSEGIVIPAELWLLMGISSTSLVASPFLKKIRDTGEENVQVVTRNLNREDAKWIDIFRGEEDSNDKKPDLAKMQMFYLTLVLIIVYAIALGEMFTDIADKEFITEFPLLSAGIITLLGISHGGYLTNKVIPKIGQGVTITPVKQGDPNYQPGYYTFTSDLKEEKQEASYHWEISRADFIDTTSPLDTHTAYLHFKLDPNASLPVDKFTLKLAIFASDGTVYTAQADFSIDNNSEIVRLDTD